MINPEIFRAYDIRGHSNKDLSPEIAYKIGFCFAKIAIFKKKSEHLNLICVGRDGRLSSEELCNALLQGIKAAGVPVKYIGLVATPTLYFADKYFAAAGSIMVTGSHNPKDDNGFKIVKSNASFFGLMIQDLKKQIEEFNWGNINLKNDYEEKPVDINRHYIQRILFNRKIKANLRVAFDPANGSGGDITSMLCSKLPCQTFMINEKIDGNFPAHQPDPTISSNLEQLRDCVLENNCDVGIGFDGDADRIGVVTKNGSFVDGDQLLCLYAKNILAKIPRAKVVCDIKVSEGVFEYIEKIGGVPIRWKTGHSFIKAKMKEANAKLGGEMSGHMFFADEYYGYDDALYAAVRLIDIISNSSESLDDMIAKLPKTYRTQEMKFSVSDELKFKLVDNIKKLLQIEKKWFINIDGLRVPSGDGWWLLRASNTGPAVTVRCESPTKEGLESVKAELKQVLDEYSIKIPL